MVNLTRGGVDVDVWIHRNSKISFLELELAVFENFILLWEGEGRGGEGVGNLSLKTPLRRSSGDMVKSFNKSLRTSAEDLPKCIVSSAANQASTRDVLPKPYRALIQK